MAINNDSIIEHFKHRGGHGRGQLLYNTTYYLMRMILADRSFESFEGLASFCEDPENLRTWLPCEADRVIFSEGLRLGLHELVETKHPATTMAAASAHGPQGWFDHAGVSRGRSVS